MTEKRFGITPELPKGWVDIIDTDDDRTLCNIRIEYANNMIKLLNELYDENEQLKQFQDRVFSWIDMHLQRLPTLRDDEFESDNEFADPSLYSRAIQILETMKRELKGDVE